MLLIAAAENQLSADGVSCLLIGAAPLRISAGPWTASDATIYDGANLRHCAPLPLYSQRSRHTGA